MRQLSFSNGRFTFLDVPRSSEPLMREHLVFKKMCFFLQEKTGSEATLKVGSERNSSQKWFVVETFQIEELKMTQKFDFNI